MSSIWTQLAWGSMHWSFMGLQLKFGFHLSVFMESLNVPMSVLLLILVPSIWGSSIFIILYFVIIILNPVGFLMRDRKEMDLNKERWRGNGRSRGRGSHSKRMYYIENKSVYVYRIGKHIQNCYWVV